MSTRRKRAPEPEEHENHERWLVTYADMITLLFVLFVVMFSMSQVDKEKYDALKQGLQEQFGTGPTIVDGGQGIQPDSPQTDPTEDNKDPQAAQNDVAVAMKALQALKAAQAAQAQDRSNLEKVRQQIVAELKKKGMENSVRFSFDERGLHITIVTDDVLFELGKANLRPAGAKVLDGVAPALAKIPNSIAIEGHTDNAPIATAQFPSNWELSTTRATSVLRYMTSNHRLPAKRVSAAGYADQRGLHPNDTPSRRSANRRVEVVVLAAAAPALTDAIPASVPAITSIAPIAPSLTAPAPPPAPAPDEEDH